MLLVTFHLLTKVTILILSHFFTADGNDDILPAEGNPDRDLWKLNCWALADEVIICID